MKKTIYLLSLIYYSLLIAFQSNAQPSAPKREFRAAWVATVNNIDWPSRGLTADQQRAEFVSILNQHQQAGLNAVVVQVRSVCDALYPSALEPWAEVLTGKQGQSPGYDPMAFMLAECRKRGMEFHAWFNPYRAVSNAQTAQLDPNHVVRKHPDWLLAQGTLRVLNPGLPAVRAYVTSIIMDVVRRYDIDGVHFDDYFYPYPPAAGTLPFNDDSTYTAQRRGIANRADWRRDNVNLLVKQVSDSIRAVKPWVKFGISPFGIWQNKTASQPLGSATNGLQGYSEIYADARLWVQSGWLDYVAPQLYWNIGLTIADYSILVPWWQAVVQNSPDRRHLYIGQAAYRVGGATENATWNMPGHMPAQLRMNRAAGIPGSIFYNTNTFNRNPLGMRDSLRTKAFYGRPALLPLMSWKGTTPPSAPTQLMAQRTGNTVLLRWQKPATGPAELDRIRQFVVYRFTEGQTVSTDDATAIRAITSTDTTAFADTDVPTSGPVRYVVTALNRLHTESAASNLATAEGVVLATETAPQGLALRLSPNPATNQVLIEYDLAEPTGSVQILILDASGRVVTELAQQGQSAGLYAVPYRLDALPGGVYFVVLKVDNGRITKRLLLDK